MKKKLTDRKYSHKLDTGINPLHKFPHLILLRKKQSFSQMMEKFQDKYKPLSKITQIVSGKAEFELRFGLNILMAFPFAHISM